MRSVLWRLACFASLGGACSREPAADAVSLQSQAVVYGDDDRLDLFECPDPALRERASQSIVALLPTAAIAYGSEGPSFVAQDAQSYGLCGAERFAEQPIVATCSGVLIAEDLVLTAAHCLDESDPQSVRCGDLALAFDYFYAARGELAPLREDALYRCDSVVVQAYQSGAERLDFAVIQLERPVSAERAPLAIARRAPQPLEALATISCPLGMPIKIDPNAQVVDARAEHEDYFRLKSDVFVGSSGGAVLDDEARLVGMLTGGGDDFSTSDAGCATYAVVPEGESALVWERASRLEPVLDALCDSGWSGALCEDSSSHSKRSGSHGCSAARGEGAITPCGLLLIGAVAMARRRRRRAHGARLDHGAPYKLVSLAQ